MNNSAHLVLQGKGGVGKSLVSSIIAQYLNQKNRNEDTRDER